MKLVFTPIWFLFISFLFFDCSKNESSTSTVAPTNKPPAVPSNPYPHDNATGVSTTTLLEFSCNDPDGDDLTYDVYLSKSNPPTTNVATNITQTNMEQSDLLAKTTYYWKIIAKDNRGGITPGNVWRFTTITDSIAVLPDMVLVNRDTFQMGSLNGDVDEQPVHSVILSSFFIGKYEVTQKMWRDVVQWKQGNATSPLISNPSCFANDSFPVTEIYPTDIKTWLGYLNEKEGLSTSANKYRLPTEAEWEFASRGGNKSKGYTYSGSDNIDDVAWYYSNSGDIVHKVGTKGANELGIYDMSGNVAEWCSDWYAAYSSDSQTDPTGPSSGTSQVVRGGEWWSSHAADCRNTRRGAVNMRFIYRPDHCGLIGFRIARTY